jgi:uncharacterized protein (UPF0210 family)
MPLQRIGEDLERSGARFLFRRIDLSPAPGTEPESNIAYALESLGGGRFGEPGTLAAAGLLTSVLKEVTLLGSKLSKPLSVRLFPISGKRAGEMTDFDFVYFVNTKVMEFL